MMADDEREDVDTDAAISEDALPEAEVDELDEETDEVADGLGFDEFGNPIDE